jgi:putative hydrolase of the HAD superfamily
MINSLDERLVKAEYWSMKPGSKSAKRHNGSPDFRAVILDYGQVLAGRPTAEEFNRMAGMFNVGYESFYELWEASRDIYDRGDLTAEEYWLMLAAKTSTSLDREQIEILRQVEVEIWSHPIPGMLEWVSQLHAGGIKTGLLSNMPWDLVTHLQTNCQWIDNFVFKTFSSEVRVTKPAPAIYEHTLRGLGVTAAEALFVDDREPNIRAARELGIHSVQFHSIAQLKHDLQALSFPILPVVPASSSLDLDSKAASPANREGQEVGASAQPR